jgi:uncharacterized protein YcbK (DUF882 family)
MRAQAVAFAAALVGLALVAIPAQADVTHVVQRGHTIEAIAHRYHVSAKAILDANHLKDAKHLKPGQTLIIPGVDGPKKKSEKLEKSDKAEHVPTRVATASLEAQPEPRGRGDGDTLHAVRLGEEFRIRVKDPHGHIPSTALKAFERLMRQGNSSHPADPRLVALVGIVSAHFGSKPIEVVSGYRAYTPTQYTAHSNHNLGKALDFRIRGVSNEALRDFCRTLRSAGCGYYPNSTFVHVDVRDTKAFWTDWSHPGEPPKYDKPGVTADEGMSDVPDDNPQPAGSSEPPPELPAEPLQKTP